MLSARIDRVPFCRFHTRLLLIGGCGYMFDALDVGIIAFVLPVLAQQWDLSPSQLGLLASGAAMGGIAGASIAGWLGDAIGRRAVMMWALAFYCVATLGCAFAATWEQFLAFRILAGAGAFAESAIIAPFLAEFAGPRFRGRYLGALAGFFSFGYALAALLGFTLIPLSDDAWRYVLGVTALPVLMLLWWRRALPESPRWLAIKGKTAEASAIVEQLEQEAIADGHTLANIATAAAPQHEVSSAARHSRRASIRLTTMTLTVWFAIGFSYYAFFSWMPTLLMQNGMTIAQSFGFSLVIYLAQIPGYFTAAWLNDVVGRRAVVASYLLLGGVAALSMAFASHANVLLMSAGFLSFFMNGAYAGLYAYTPELFATHIRARSQGFAGTASRVGAVISPIAVGYLFPAHGFFGVFGLTALILGAGAMSVLLLGPTTRGRALEAVSGSHKA